MEEISNKPDNTKETVQINFSREEFNHIMQVKVVEEAKKDLITWVKMQLLILVAVITVFGGIGFYAGIKFLVSDLVSEKVTKSVKEKFDTKIALVDKEIDRVFRKIQDKADVAQELIIVTKEEVNKSKAALEDLRNLEFMVDNALDSFKNKVSDLDERLASYEANINGLQVRSKNLQKQIELLKGGIEKDSKIKIDINQKQLTDLKKNSEYSVLIFFKQEQKSRAEEIGTRLLTIGYRSSITATDFSELKKQHPSGTLYISYTRRGENIVQEIKEELIQLDMKVNIVYPPKATRLKRGDIQILIF